jgi:hypothetical protein
MGVRRRRLRSACASGFVCAPFYLTTWQLEGDGLVHVVDLATAFVAEVSILGALTYLIGAALGEGWELGED